MSANIYKDNVYSTCVTIHPTQILLTTELLSGIRSHKNLQTYKTNFKNNKPLGKISKQARKKISRALDYILYLAKPKTIPPGYRGEGLKFKICFVTMTLPAKQVHSDKEILDNILQPFLNYLRKHYNVKNYIWRAEKQKNSNLHFHMILDKFIDKYELRNAWNKYLQNLGYVRMYKENQLDYHKNGFKLRTRLLKTWTKADQEKAYLTGLTQDWNNPNTTDIHSTKKVRNLKKYLCKYLCKSRNETIQEKDIDNKSFNDLFTMSGRLWACSESVSRPRGAKTDFDSDIQKELNYLFDSKKCTFYSADHYTIYGIHCTRIDPGHCPTLSKLWTDYIKTAFPD